MIRWFGFGRAADLQPLGPLTLSLEFGSASNQLQRAAAVEAFKREGLPPPTETVLRPPLRHLGPPPQADLCVTVVERNAPGPQAHRQVVEKLLPDLFEAWNQAEKAASGLVIRRLHVSTGRRETYYAWRKTDAVSEIERGVKALIEWDHRPGFAYGWDAEAGAWKRL